MSSFDLIAHGHILNQLGSFPAREMIRAWLKAGVVEQGRLHRTEDGVPQGGVVSPLLLNIALHGMEHAAGVQAASRALTSSACCLVWQRQRRLGAVADEHPHDDHDRQAGDRHAGHGLTTVSYTPNATARHFCPPTSHQGLLEPCAGQLARTVLRGLRRGNAPELLAN